MLLGARLKSMQLRHACAQSPKALRLTPLRPTPLRPTPYALTPYALCPTPCGILAYIPNPYAFFLVVSLVLAPVRFR